jgi:hypothetical protein
VCDLGYECTAEQQCRVPDECPDLQALLCEGFENGLDGYSPNLRNGTLSIVPSPGGGVGQALRADVEGAEDTAAIILRFAEIQSGSLFFRVHLYMPRDTITDSVKILAFEPSTIAQTLDIKVNADESVGVYFANSGQIRDSNANVAQQDAWQCLQGELIVSDNAGGVKMSINGTQVLDTGNSFDTHPANGIGAAFVGLHWSDEQEDATTIYLDAFVVDTKPIPCQRLNP